MAKMVLDQFKSGTKCRTPKISLGRDQATKIVKQKMCVKVWTLRRKENDKPRFLQVKRPEKDQDRD